MDFWSRLLAHTPLSSGSSRKDYARDPARRLHRFEREYSHLLQVWRNSSNLAHDDEAAERIEIHLQELTNILSDESRRPLPHPCITFSARKQVYVPVAKVATASANEWVIKEAVLFFATLIESEEEAFVENDAFSASLTNLLVRITGANSIRLGSDTEARVVELAFNITTKIRLDPDILPTWFKARSGGAATTREQQHQQQQEQSQQLDDHDRFAGRTQKQDFPLFYLLIDYIHHEGKVGDFARTGLLYIIESASSSVALEQWIVESDLSTLMATGLGALYSQLSRKLVIDHPPQNLPPVLAFSDYQHPKSDDFEIVSSCSPEFQAHLETFLSHLLFWQDVLNHCRSVEVKSTLLEHFQVIFLQQLLYPSLLESSDIDGGSSVAVLTYLRRILESLDHPDMINLILHYLLALPDIIPSAAASSSLARDSVSAARKRKSMDLASMMAARTDHDDVMATPLLFNLVDLILACLRSHSHQTINATLQLVSAILKRHHRYAVITLLHTEDVRSEASHRTIGAHKQEVDFLMALAASIGGQDNFDEVYDSVLKDTTTRLEGHPCSLKLVAPKTSTNNHKLPAIPDSLPGAPSDVGAHTLRPDDPVLNIVLDRLEAFFLNPVETNLALTDALFDLAVCGFMSLEGWFLRNPQRYEYGDDDEEDSGGGPSPAPPDPDSPIYAEFQKAQSMKLCRRRPRWVSASLPRFLVTLQLLADQVSAYRETIPRFDDLLQQRREAFQTADNPAPPPALPARPKNPSGTPVPAASSSTPVLDQRTSQEDYRSASPARPSGLEGFAQRILSELGTPTRSGSPRGRREALLQRPSSGRSTPTPAPVLPQPPPREFPINYDSPSRSGGGPGLARSYSPAAPSPAVEGLAPDDAVTSQMKAFEAIDQSILARRVGLPALNVRDDGGPGRQIEPIPLRFEKDGPPRTPLAEGAGDEIGPDKVGSPADGAVDADASPSRRNGRAEDSDEASTPAEEQTVSVSHVLTNVIILQSFLFELASLVQVRAGLFDEVRFV